MGMKKVLVYIAGTALLLSAIAFAADEPASNVSKTEAVKTNPIRIAKMNAKGKVIEISEKAIKIERAVRDKVETMEFILDKPTEKIAVNDAVKIAYIEKDGQLLATRVVKALPKKVEKKDVKATTEKVVVPKK
jgi:hypothetical protein